MSYRKYWKQTTTYSAPTPFGQFMGLVDKMLPWKPYPPSWSKRGFIKKTKSATPLVRIPVRIWQDLMAMSHLANGEYSTFLEIDHNEAENEYKVLSWYLPYQDASWAHVKLTQEGAIKLATEALDRLPRMYGVFHIHPSRHTPGSGYVAGLSSQDYDAMWKWVSNAKRGVFIVSHIGGGANAELCTEVDGVRHLTDMDISIDIDVDQPRQVELAAMMAERVGSTPIFYVKRAPKGGTPRQWPYTSPYTWDWRGWARGYDPEEDTELTVVDLSELAKGYWEIGDLAVIKKDATIAYSAMSSGIPYMVSAVTENGVFLFDIDNAEDDREHFYFFDEIEALPDETSLSDLDEVERAMIIHDVSLEDIRRLEDLREI